MMTINEARAALNVPAHTANNNCVQDGQARLREALAFEERFAAKCLNKPLTGDEEASSTVVKAVEGLHSWIRHHDEYEAQMKAKGWR